MPLATRKNRSGNLVKLGRCENKGQVLGRLFENFQQGVKCRRRKHMHLVNDVHTLFDGNGGEHGLLTKLTDIVNTVVGSGIYLNDIKNAAVLDAGTGRAFAAWITVFGMLAVQGLGKNLCTGGLARSSCSDEQVRMGQPAGNYLVFQSFGNVLLTNDSVKGLRPPFPIQSLIHGVENLSYK